MFVIVTGGSGSGKSAFAEEKIAQLGAGKRIYIATMMCFDEESRKRVRRHRRMRDGKGFATIERYTGLESVTLPEDGIVLLECMSNLVANEMFSENGAREESVSRILNGVRHVREQVRHLVIVTNEIFSDGMDYDEETRRYQEYLGEINQRLAREADQVVEVVYGIPLYHKRKAVEG